MYRFCTRFLSALTAAATLAAPAWAEEVDPGTEIESLVPVLDAFCFEAENCARIDSVGDGNSGVIGQNGTAHRAGLWQFGNDNYASIEQIGASHRALVLQDGNGNFVHLRQEGSGGHSARFEQIGDRNSIDVVQQGSVPNTLTYTQLGNGLSSGGLAPGAGPGVTFGGPTGIRVTQSGGATATITQTTGP
jgi:hypothetical protein